MLIIVCSNSDASGLGLPAAGVFAYVYDLYDATA